MIDVAKVDNSKRITVLPQDGSNPQNNGGIIQAGNEMEGPFISETSLSKSQQRFMNKIQAESAPAEVVEEAVCPKCGKSPCECPKEEMDVRANKTYRDLLKAKFRSMGRSPLMVCGDEENLEKSYDDMMTASFIKPNKETGKMEPVHIFKKD